MAIKETNTLIDNPMYFCDENGIFISEEQAEKVRKQLNLVLPNAEEKVLNIIIFLGE